MDKKIKIADMGTGPGFFAISLAKRGYDVTAVDYTQEMLNHAMQNAGTYASRIPYASESPRAPSPSGALITVPKNTAACARHTAIP